MAHSYGLVEVFSCKTPLAPSSSSSTSKNKQSLKQHCHPYQKFQSIKLTITGGNFIYLQNCQLVEIYMVPSTSLTITYETSIINKSMVYIFCYTFGKYRYLSYLNGCNFHENQPCQNIYFHIVKLALLLFDQFESKQQELQQYFLFSYLKRKN